MLSILDLPAELDIDIAANLDKNSLHALSQVSKHYRRVTDPFLHYWDLRFSLVEPTSWVGMLLQLLDQPRLERMIKTVHVDSYFAPGEYDLEYDRACPEAPLADYHDRIADMIDTVFSKMEQSCLDNLDFNRYITQMDPDLDSDGQIMTSPKAFWLHQIITKKAISFDATLALICCMLPNLKAISFNEPYAHGSNIIPILMRAQWKTGVVAPFQKLTTFEFSAPREPRESGPLHLLPAMRSLSITGGNQGWYKNHSNIDIWFPTPLPSSVPQLTSLKFEHLATMGSRTIINTINSPWFANLKALHIARCGGHMGDRRDFSLVPALAIHIPQLERLRLTNQHPYSRTGLNPPDHFRSLTCLKDLAVDLPLLVANGDHSLSVLQDPSQVFPPSLESLTLDSVPAETLHDIIAHFRTRFPSAQAQFYAVGYVAGTTTMKKPRLCVTGSPAGFRKLTKDDVDFPRTVADLCAEHHGLVFEIAGGHARKYDVLIKSGFTSPLILQTVVGAPQGFPEL